MYNLYIFSMIKWNVNKLLGSAHGSSQCEQWHSGGQVQALAFDDRPANAGQPMAQEKRGKQ